MASLQFAILWYFCFSVHWVVNGASGDEYYIGTGRYDITGPAVETEMMGYAMPTQINNGIHFRQYSRAFIVADSLKKTRIVFINTDICMGSQIIKIQVLKKLQNLYGKTYSDANVLISGIHTHSGPAGYFQYVLFEVMSLGFVNQTLDAIVDGIVESVKIAHDNMVLGHLFINSGMLLDASINRSPSAYLNNAEEERSLKQKQSMAPGNKSKRRRGFRSHFKRSKNDERKRLESRLKDREGRVALQPISSNVSCADASTFTPLSFHTLKTDVPPDWVVFESEDTIRFCLMKSTPPTVTRSVSVNADFTWYIHAHGRVVPRDNEIIKRLPEKVASVSVLRDILSVVKAARKCPGNPEERFVQVIEKRGGSVVGVDGKVSAIIDNQEDIVSGGITYSKTVRHTDCEVFCSPDTANLRRCPCCKKYRSQLHVMYSRQSKASDRVSHNSHTNYRFLSSAEKDERLHNLQRAKVAQNKCNKRLSEKLNELIDNEGVRLTEQDTSDVTSIFNSVTDDVIKNFKDGSIQQIFWEQQKNYSLLSNKKSMKWHPLVIRFALSLKYASSSAYRMARNSGLIALPSERTLRDYTHWITVKDGIQAEMVQQMKKCLEFEGMQTFEKQFSLSMDEIKIRSGLVFKKDTGELTGFCNLGQVNHDLEKLSDYLSDTTPANEVPTLSDQMLVFMVRPIFKPSFSFPVAMYPSTNLTGERLYPIVFEVIEALELHSIPVVSLTSDGNSPNRRLYRLCQLNTEKPTYKTKNPFADRDIFFMCDAPHLIKTARNCLANSHAHSKTRNLQRNGQEISWKHVEQLYLTETEKIGGVRLCPKLTRNHIWLNPYSRMKVYLATQVMSETVASALQLLDEEKTRETRLFIRMMDRFFDALNVKNPLEGKHKRKDSRAPYYSTKDERFKWLKETFLNYLDNWEREAMSDKKFRAKENRRKCISRETLEGLKITVKSFLELGPMLLQKPGAKYLLSEVFSQDPLERYFSKQRHRGGSNDNPTVEEFRTNTATLVQQQSIHKDLKTMNVEAGCNQVDVSAVCQPLRKRRRGDFVAAFAQSNEGDVSPNTKGPHCLDTGLPCDFNHSTCNGKTELCVAFGPGEDMFDSTRIIGEKQYLVAKALFDNATSGLSGPVDYIHTFVDFSNVTLSVDGKEVHTCPPAMGFSFAAGTIDGPGAFSFTQGDTNGNEFWKLVRNFLKDPSKEQIDCHHPKPILLDTGEMTYPYPWQPKILPLQLLRVGQLVIIGVPAEFSTMSGRRLRNSVKKVLLENGFKSNVTVVIAGLSNTYSDYVTTFEEYQIQRYEGASTVYGPHTLNAYIQEFGKLAVALAKSGNVDPGPPPPNYLHAQWSLHTGVIFDAVPSGKSFGDVNMDVKSSYKLNDTVLVEFWAGNPRNNLMTENTFLNIELKNNSQHWVVVHTDASWETKFSWRHTSEILGESLATVIWNIPSDAVPGTYRIQHLGYHKEMLSGKVIPYSGVSSEFHVTTM